jgi:hypothetical protein
MRSRSAVPLLSFLLLACSATMDLPPAGVRDLPWGEAPADQAALAARALAERGDVRGALRELDGVLAVAPHHVDARRLRQDLLRERGRRGLLWREACQELQTRPDDGLAHYLAGRIARTPAQKLAHFEQSVRLAPASLWPWLGLAHGLRGQQPQRALAIYERLFAASGRHPVVGIAYAAALREQGALAAAVAVYEQLRGDPRARALADVGLAQVALAREDRRAAWESLLAALRGRPFDAAVQSLVGAFLDAGIADDQAAQLLDVLRADPARLQQFGAGAGALPLAGLLQRSGHGQLQRSTLEAAAPDARRPVARRLLRRLLLAHGDVRGFLELAVADVPLAVVDQEPNQVRGRWLSLLRGPWRTGEPLPTAEQAQDLVAALLAVGWLPEAELTAAAALRRFAGDAGLQALLAEAGAQLAFESGLRRLLYTGYQRRDTSGLDRVVGRVRELSQQVFGRDVVGEVERFEAPLIGEMLDPFVGGLAAHLDRYNRHLVLGRRAGGVAEGLLLTRLSLQELGPSAELPLPARCREVVGIDRDVRSLGTVLGGDLAGVALLNHFLVDYDAVREWAHELAERRRIAAEDGMALLGDPLPDDPGDDPFDASWRLTVSSPVPDQELEAAVLDMIRHHERQHLVDAFYYLPVEHNVWRSLGLLFEFGFSPSAIEAEMERRAELASLAVSPHTELVLAHILDFHADPTARSPHHQGFGALAAELVAALQRQGVSREAALPSRWHLLPPAVVRQAARGLLGRGS